MKKLILILLFFTGFLQAQTLQNPTYGNTTTNTLKIKTPATVTTVNFLPAYDADETTLSKIAPINVTIPYTPVNYTASTQSIGQHLTGIDTRLGQISSTTAGITQRVYFTADNTTVTAGTFFTSSLTGKGSTATGSPPALVLADNTKGYFTKDIINVAFPSATIGYAGSYTGQLTVSASPTPVATQQRFTIEIYRTNNGGTPIASGVSGAPTGDLGVTVVAILDSGIVNLSAGSITNVPVSGILTQNITINTGERIRYHVSAAKIGTGGGNVTFGVYYGSSYNSYYDVPVAVTTDAVINKSAVTGITATDALNTLNANKIDGSGTINYMPYFSAIRTLSNSNTYLNGSFPPSFLPSGSPNFMVKTVVKGNANDSSSYDKQAFGITDDLDRLVAKFDNSGRLDLHDYSGQGGVTCLYNMATGAIGRYSHYAFGARNSAGNLNTTNSILGIVTDPTTATMSSKFQLGYMDNVDTSTGYQQPNKTVIIDKTGIDLPMIPIKNATGLDLKNDASGSAPVQIRYFANNTVERGILEMSVNPTSPFEADLIYKTKGFAGTPTIDRFKINGNTGQTTIPNLAGATSALVEADVNGNLQRSTGTLRPYKVYTALLSQTGTSAPTVVNVLENTLGGTLVWTRNSTGEYYATLSGAFSGGFSKLYFSMTNNDYVSTTVTSYKFRQVNSNTVSLSTYLGTTLTDSLIGTATIEIRVYN